MRVDGQRHDPAALPPGKKPATIVQEAVWINGPLDGCGKSRSHRDSIAGPSSSQRVAIPTELSQPLFQENIGTKLECSQVASCHNLSNYSYINHSGNRDSSVRVVTWRQVGWPKNCTSNVGKGKSVTRSLKPPDRLWASHCYIFLSYRVLFHHTET